MGKNYVEKRSFTRRSGKPNYLVMGIRITDGCCYTHENWWWTKLFRIFDTKKDCISWIREVGASKFLTMDGHDLGVVVKVKDVLKLGKTLDNYCENPYGWDTWFNAYDEDYKYLYSCPVEKIEWRLNPKTRKWILDKKPLKPYEPHQEWR